MDISLTKPHARSCYAHLPLRASEATAVAITKADRERYAERPLTLMPCYHVLTESQTNAKRDAVTLAGIRDRFVSLNIADETSGAEQERVPCKTGLVHVWEWTHGKWDDARTFQCAHCATCVTVGPKRIASAPKIPCPYEARNRREARDEKSGHTCPLRKGDGPNILSTSETDTTTNTNGDTTMPKTIKTTKATPTKAAPTGASKGKASKASKASKVETMLARETARVFSAPAPAPAVVETPAPAPVVETAPVVECCAACGQRIRKPAAPRKSGTYAASSLANPELGEKRKQAGFKAAATLRAKREAAAQAAAQATAA